MGRGWGQAGRSHYLADRLHAFTQWPCPFPLMIIYLTYHPSKPHHHSSTQLPLEVLPAYNIGAPIGHVAAVHYCSKAVHRCWPPSLKYQAI